MILLNLRLITYRWLSVAIDGKQEHLSVKATVSRIPRIKTLPFIVMPFFGMTVKLRPDFF